MVSSLTFMDQKSTNKQKVETVVPYSLKAPWRSLPGTASGDWTIFNAGLEGLNPDIDAETTSSSQRELGCQLSATPSQIQSDFGRRTQRQNFPRLPPYNLNNTCTTPQLPLDHAGPANPTRWTTSHSETTTAQGSTTASPHHTNVTMTCCPTSAPNRTATTHTVSLNPRSLNTKPGRLASLTSPQSQTRGRTTTAWLLEGRLMQTTTAHILITSAPI
ncbi:hypothetical protein EDB83DRAFT_397243 [Lactarius deliciosus]|nr:hypothetical protein EDB83DRAFT_397243 [Lactarius deliciosus]